MITSSSPAPIVLAHGLFGFKRVGVGSLTLLAYFRRIPAFFESQGRQVFVPRVHPTGGILRRSRRLGEQIEARFPDQPVHLVAHSMGGLDARQLLLHPRWCHRILSLTTIGSPHLGSSLAERARRRFDPFYRLLRAIGWDHQGVLDILPDRARAWHAATPQPFGVPCFSVAGDPASNELSWPMQLPFRWLEGVEGPNDGLVSVPSALAFGEPLASPPVDHLQQMNWFCGKSTLGIEARVKCLYQQILDNIELMETADEDACPPIVRSTAGLPALTDARPRDRQTLVTSPST